MGKNNSKRDGSFADLKKAFDRLYDLVQSCHNHLPDLCRCGFMWNDYGKPCKGTTTCGERELKRRTSDALMSP